MKITRSIRHHIAMGKYEWLEVGAEVELTSDDNHELAQRPEEFFDQLGELLEKATSVELIDAAATTGESGSYVLRHPLVTQNTHDEE
ncbi:hypothetical protein [Actinomadura atramentaria]|uniref:hypothetical protein n=1 Tax=Actinomadura atramentaria TaxID=1990 RepID=UPI000366295A|nr:hypothetical protein [Actinomadura atramentaria]